MTTLLHLLAILSLPGPNPSFLSSCLLAIKYLAGRVLYHAMHPKHHDIMDNAMHVWGAWTTTTMGILFDFRP